MPEQKEIIFLNRAYNDMDMQMPLVESFAREGRFRVRVIGYPCDGGTGAPYLHEAVPFMKAHCKNVSFETVLDRPPAPLPLRLLHKLSVLAAAARRKCGCPVSSLLLKILHVGMLKILKYCFGRNSKWLERVAATWNPAAIVLDEVYAQPRRSYMTDIVLPALQEKGVPVFMIQTGHHIYKNPSPTGKGAPPYKRTKAQRFFVPSTLDGEINRSHFPQENIQIAGNVRMDKDWLCKLTEDILKPPYVPRAEKLPEGRPKIALMLSKLNYGIEAEPLKETIRALGRMEGAAVAIKPHTRGMKFDFMTKDETGHAVLADDIPSPLLIDWADIVLFTGSSIAYHAMLTGKPAGFLKYCQNLPTLFDEGKSAIVFQKQEDLLSALTKFRDHEEAFLPPQRQNEIAAHLCDEVYAGLKSGATAQHYKGIILKDIGL